MQERNNFAKHRTPNPENVTKSASEYKKAVKQKLLTVKQHTSMNDHVKQGELIFAIFR